MSRLSRAESQRQNRGRVLAAARDEFTERGFRDAKIDAIAERAGLTRGAVYSNFPGKQALYFAVLAEDAAHPAAPVPQRPGQTRRAALGEFARAWVPRLPLATDDQRSAARLGVDLLPEIIAEERTRLPYEQLMRLSAILLGLALEQLPGASGGRQVRLAEAVLTMLQGASQLAAAAPGFLEPFTVVSACEHLADLHLDDTWQPPHLAHVPAARRADAPWSPPAAADAVRGGSADLSRDGVLAVLGLHRLAAIEEAVRTAGPADQVTAVLVTGVPEELAPLARLVVAEVLTCLRQAVPDPAWPRLQLVHDEPAAVAAAAGVPAVSDATETAVRIRAGRVAARAEGFGACHAAASA